MISSLTTSVTALSCNPSSVNIEGGSSYIHLDDYIEWNSPGVIPRVFPLVLDTRILILYNCYLERRVDPEGYPRVIWRRVDLEGAREIITRRGRALLALVASPRDEATGSHLS